MSLVGCYKKDDNLYLFASLSRRMGSYILDVDNPRNYPIQKFKNCVIGFSGPIDLLLKVVNAYDFNSIPEDFDLGYLLRKVYPFYLDFTSNEDTDAKFDNGYFYDSDFQLFILGKNDCYYMNPSNVDKVRSLSSAGEDRIIRLLSKGITNLEPLEFLKTSFEETAKYTSGVNYPFQYVSNSNLNELMLINEKNEIKIDEYIEEWRKLHG